MGDWQPMLILLAVLSLIVGNVTAIAQTNLNHATNTIEKTMKTTSHAENKADKKK